MMAWTILVRRRLEVIIVVFVVVVLLSKMYLYVTTNSRTDLQLHQESISKTAHIPRSNSRVEKFANNKIPPDIDLNKGGAVYLKVFIPNISIAVMSGFRARLPTIQTSAPIPTEARIKTVIKVVNPDPELHYLQNVIALRRIHSILRASMETESPDSVLVDNIPGFVKGMSKSSVIKPRCPGIPPDLVGFQDVNFTLSQYVSMADIQEEHPDVTNGEWSPPSCTARSKVAIVVPFRDRYHHLEIMLHHLIPVWKRQQLSFHVFVVEQYGNDAFNKGRIMNAAFLEASKAADFNCFAFHDVDMVPINDRNMYTCPDMPRHMSVLVDELENAYPVYGMVGGVFSIQTNHYRLVNGYSNRYWGWGAEDDDMGLRVQNRGLRILRPPSFIAKYRMIPHVKRHSKNEKKMYRNLRNQRGFLRDGLNSVHYKIRESQAYPLYTYILTDIS